MAYLNLDLDYFDHPQTLRLIGLLGRGAEVLPIRLWAYCGKFHAEKGELAGLAGQEIEAVLKWWGKSGEAVEAMVKAEYLERGQDGTYRAAHWTQHQGHIYALKVRSAAMNKERWDRYRLQKLSVGSPDRSPSRSPSGNPPSVRPSKKEGARGAGTETADSGTFGVPKPRYCTCGNRIYDSGKTCLECSCCSQCKEPSEDLKLDAGQDLRLCPSCRKENQ